jgi:hypothetical protein
MSEPPDLKVLKGGKKEPCVYCGEDPHPTILACPRIYSVVISEEGYVCEIVFRRHWRVAGADPV